MKRTGDSKPKRSEAVARWVLATVLLFTTATHARAQPHCVSTPLQGLPEVAAGGQRVRVTAELDSGCNRKMVDEASLVCVNPDGSETRHAIDLYDPRRGPMQAEVVFEVPNLGSAGEIECVVEFFQCKELHRTCPVSMRFVGSLLELPDPEIAPPPEPERRTGRRPRVVSPPPSPVPRGPVSPARKSGGQDNGRFLRGLGWVGVAVGLGVYADATSKEQEGRFEESRESEELANQILGGSSVLLLIGYVMDGSGFLEEPEGIDERRIRPSLAVDPFHRAVMVRVSVRFD